MHTNETGRSRKIRSDPRKAKQSNKHEITEPCKVGVRNMTMGNIRTHVKDKNGPIVDQNNGEIEWATSDEHD